MNRRKRHGRRGFKNTHSFNIWRQSCVIMKRVKSYKRKQEEPTSAQILPTIEIVSTGYNPRKVSAPRRIASLPKQKENER